jgi:hypothetical protein
MPPRQHDSRLVLLLSRFNLGTPVDSISDAGTQSPSTLRFDFCLVSRAEARVPALTGATVTPLMEIEGQPANRQLNQHIGSVPTLRPGS